MLRKIRYIIEAFLLIIGVLLFRIIPLDIASSLGGLLARVFGPFSRAHVTARKNIELAMPDVTAKERNRILRKMWDNIGRVIGEYPHLSRKIMTRRITIEGLEYLEQVKNSGKGALFVSGHFANWEIAPLTSAIYGMPLVIIYREANNPIADWVIRRIRSGFNIAMYKKGRDGAQKILGAIKSGHPVGMLIDQKMNDGKAIMFFGREAMTATAATSMAIKLQVPLLAARVVRTHGAHFQVSVQPPFIYDIKADPSEAMLELHKLFESWIREYPEQWFWVHRRWGS